MTDHIEPAEGPKKRQRRPESPDCLTYSVDRAAELLGISRNSAYAAAKTGDLPVMKFGKRLRVSKATVEKLLQAQASV